MLLITPFYKKVIDIESNTLSIDFLNNICFQTETVGHTLWSYVLHN